MSTQREQILEAARQCFERWGPERTRMDDIAKAVGIARPNLYRYFPSKMSVLVEVIGNEMRVINEARRSRLPIEGDTRTLISRSVSLGIELALEDSGLLSVMRADSLDLTAEALVTQPSLMEIQAEYWAPIFEHGRSRGEIRADLTDDTEIIRWIQIVQFMCVERREFFPDIAAITRHFDRFVVPAIVVPD